MPTQKAETMMVELKARVKNLAPLRSKLIQYGAKKKGIFHQIDTYFQVPKGRLKLREVAGKTDAELIYYEREDVAEPKRSYIFVLTIPEPQTFKQILEKIVKISTVVDKVREIYLYKRIQVHLDRVKNLGSFIEFELVSSQDTNQQKKDLLRLEKLREKLDINPERLERLSYSDLI